MMSTIIIAITAALLLAVLYFVFVLLEVVVQNRKAHKFFQINSPKLPVVPNANFLTGHITSVLAPKKNWKIVEDLHEKYGPTFGYYIMNHPFVSTKDLDLIKLVEVDEGHKHIDRHHLGIPNKEFNNSVFQVTGERWRRSRRVMSSAITNLKVRGEISPHIEQEVDKLAASLKGRLRETPSPLSVRGNDLTGESASSSSLVVCVKDMMERYALAVIARVFYDKSDVIDYDLDLDPFTNDMVKLGIDSINPVTHASVALPRLRSLCEWISLQFLSAGKIQKKLVNFVESSTDLKRKLQAKKEANAKSNGGAQPPSCGQDSKQRLVDVLIDGFVDKRINYDGIMGSLCMLVLAGSATTADTLACMIWQLARHPEIQEKLRRTILEEGIDADYMQWCINETIRYHPAVPLGTGRVLAADVEVNGQHLAKGTFIMPSSRAIHHDPKIWPEPERFNPDRWRDQASFHPAAFMGFGLGQRNCFGAKMAIHEIKLMIRMMLTNFRISSCDETPAEWSFSSPAMFYTDHDDEIKIRFTALTSVPSCATTCGVAANHH